MAPQKGTSEPLSEVSGVSLAAVAPVPTRRPTTVGDGSGSFLPGAPGVGLPLRVPLGVGLGFRASFMASFKGLGCRASFKGSVEVFRVWASSNGSLKGFRV